MLCTYVSEEGADGEGVVSEAPSHEEGGDGEGVDSEVSSLLLYTHLDTSFSRR